MSLNESIVEDAAIKWFGELGNAVGHGPQLAPGEPSVAAASARHADRRATGKRYLQVRFGKRTKP